MSHHLFQFGNGLFPDADQSSVGSGRKLPAFRLASGPAALLHSRFHHVFVARGLSGCHAASQDNGKQNQEFRHRTPPLGDRGFGHGRFWLLTSVAEGLRGEHEVFGRVGRRVLRRTCGSSGVWPHNQQGDSRSAPRRLDDQVGLGTGTGDDAQPRGRQPVLVGVNKALIQAC